MKAKNNEFISSLVQWAEEKKAEKISSFDISEKSQFADHMIICHGSQELHVKAIAQHIIDKSEEIKNKPFAVEGFENGKWVLIDYVDIVVHVFNVETRNYYQLDELWKINSKNIKSMSNKDDKADDN